VLAGWFATAAFRLYSNEDAIDLGEGFGIIAFQNPAFFALVIFVEDAQVDGLLNVGTATAPYLKRGCSL
jgi:hypothetical protein